MKFPLVLLTLLGSLALCQADTVRLQINDPDGKPVAGAQVRVLEVKLRGDQMETHDYISDAAGTLTVESKGAVAIEPTATATAQVIMAARIMAPGLAVRVFQLKPGDNTLALKQGRSVEGTAVDSKEQPAANVELLINTLPFTFLSTMTGPPQGENVPLPDSLAIRTKTDAQGRWKFDSLPMTGQVSIEAYDARYKRDKFPVDVTQPIAPLHLLEGITVKGRLLKPDGTPAAGIKIFTGYYNAQIETDKDGRFEVIGIGSPDIRLQILPQNQNLPFVVPPRSVEGLKAGEIRDIGDWKAEKGTKLKGRVVSAADKKPLAGADISVSGSGANNTAQSDKNGNFELTVANDISGLSVNLQGYVNSWQWQLPDVRQGVIDVGTVELKPGQKVKGVVVDEAGKPVAGVPLYAETPTGTRSYSSPTQDDGTFSFEAVETSSQAYTLKAEGFEFLSGATFKVEANKSPELRVVMKGDAKQYGKHLIEGRVVDEEGKPVSGAQIAFSVEHPGNNTDWQDVVSQNDGSIKSAAAGLITGLAVVGIEHATLIRDQEKIETKDGNYNIVITLQKRGTLHGRVVDAAGNPVKEAAVALQDSVARPVACNANGEFTLADAPLKNIVLLASNGPSLATVTIPRGDAPIEIALPAAPAAEDKAALIEQILPSATLEGDWTDKWDVLGPQRLETMLQNGTGREGNDQWMKYLEELARRSPQEFLQREAELKELTPQKGKSDVEGVAMLASARSKDPAMMNKARAWLAQQGTAKRSISSETVTNLLALAQVGASLSKADGDMWLDYAAQLAEQLDNGSRTQNLWDWSALAARVSNSAPQTLSEGWHPTQQVRLLASALRTWIRDGNDEAVRQGWDDLQKLAPEIDKAPPLKEDEYAEKPSALLRQTRARYAEFVARTNPQGALDLLAPLNENEKLAPLLVIAREAVKNKQFEIARSAIKAVVNSPQAPLEQLARAASIANEFDAAYADTLWAQIYTKSDSAATMRGSMAWQPSIAPYAQERAKKSPGEGRILIEREWGKRLLLANKTTPNEWDPNSQAMQSLAQAMASISPRRALEMTEKLTGTGQLRSHTRGAIIIALLSSGENTEK